MSKVPRHIAIILDGNRRFAKKLMLKPWMGHEWGARKVEKLLNWCNTLGIKEVTLYAFSVDNFNRPKQEFNYLMNLFKKEFDNIMKEKKQKDLKAKEIRINFIGRLWMFPESVQQRMHKLIRITKDNGNNVVNFAMAYGGRQEVIDAVRKIGEEIKEGKIDAGKINEELFAKNLYLNSDPELVIRTGGEKRTSNFLPWQSIYSEWVFIEKPWPEFEQEDLINAIEDYSSRGRRFGR